MAHERSSHDDPRKAWARALREAASAFSAIPRDTAGLDALRDALARAFDDLAPPGASPERGAFARALATSPDPLRGLTLLYLDRNELNRRATRMFLEPLGVHLEIARDPEEAAAMLARDRYDGALVGCDPSDPLLEDLRRCSEAIDARGRGTMPFLVAVVESAARSDEAAKRGATEVLTLPVDPERLVSVLCALNSRDAEGPAFDLAASLARFDGKKRSLARALTAFASDARRHLETLESEAASDLDVKRVAHALKGSAGIIGAEATAAAAQALDEGVKRGDRAAAASSRIALVAELSRLVSETEAAAKELVSEAVDAPAGDRSETDLRAAAEELRGLLLAGDTEAELVFERRAALWSSLERPFEVARLAKCLRTFDYPEAATIVEELLKATAKDGAT